MHCWRVFLFCGFSIQSRSRLLGGSQFSLKRGRRLQRARSLRTCHDSLAFTSQRLYSFLRLDFETIVKNYICQDGQHVAYAKVDKIRSLSFQKRVDVVDEEDKGGLTALVNTERSRFGLELESKHACNEANRSCIVHTPHNCHQERQHE